MENETFSTRDIYLSAVLLSLKFSLANIDFQIDGMKNRPIGYFSFSQTPELAEVEQKYWSRNLAVEPVSFIENLYKLKAEVSNSFNKGVRTTADERDIHFAATLLTLRFNLLNIEYKIGGYKNQLIGYFKFENSSQLDKAKEEYLKRESAVEPILFISNLRTLKSRLTNQYKNPYTNTKEVNRT